VAAGAASRVIRSPGRLVVEPANLSTEFPYGGIEVGKSQGFALTPLGSPFLVMCEALGEATDVLEGENRWAFSVFLRGWDSDAIRYLLPEGYDQGTVTRHATYSVPGTATPGESALDRSLVLIYVPDDTIQSPAVLLYRAIPDWSDGAELAFQRGQELGLPLTFECVRDDNGQILAIGRLPDLSLT